MKNITASLDDATHRHELSGTQAVHGALLAAGLRIDSAGIVQVPFFEDHMLALGRSADDVVSRTLACWSFTPWCRYVAARCPG